MGKTVMQTARLLLREMVKEDYAILAAMMQDRKVAIGRENIATDREVAAWLALQLYRYSVDGLGVYAVLQKKTGQMIGQCGISWQLWDERKIPEISYMFRHQYWHAGFATEAAVACREYAFTKPDINEVFSVIPSTNIAAQRLALRLGMAEKGYTNRRYGTKQQECKVYSVRRSDISKH